MSEQDEVERLLKQVPVPGLDDGPHRARLRQELFQLNRKEDSTMSRFQNKKPLIWISCTLVVIAMVAAAVPAVRKAFVVHSEVRQLEPLEVTLPDGTSTVLSRSAGASVVMKSDEPGFTEAKARERYDEIQQLIATGECEPVDVRQSEDGTPIYIYEFTLSDGSVEQFAATRPLGKETKSQVKLDAELAQLIREGSGTLVYVSDLGEGEKAYVYRFVLSDGSSPHVGFGCPLSPRNE